MVRWSTRAVIFAGLALTLAAGCSGQRPSVGPALPTDPPDAMGSPLARTLQREGSDLLLAGLMTESPTVPRRRQRELRRGLSAEAKTIRATVTSAASSNQTLEVLNAHFFGLGGYAAITDMSAPENVSLAAVLDNRRGTCLGLAIVYLALAQRLGLDAHAVATPVHLFVRVRLDGRSRNVELLEAGQEIPNDVYRRRYKIDEASIATGVFMRDLANEEVLAHLLSNQAVALSKKGKPDDALARYDAALQLHPQLVTAWYNQGIDLMSAGRLDEALASFNRAIELYPSDAQAHNNRGLAKFKLGDFEGARSDWMKALELEPGLPEAEANLKRLTSSGGGSR